MTEILDKYREEAKEVAAATHGLARDDRDVRQDDLTSRLLQMYERLQEEMFGHMSDEGKKVQELKEAMTRIEGKVDDLTSAFPNKDSVGHRLAHEKEMKDAGISERFWQAIKLALAILAIGGAAAWAAHALWPAFLMGPK